MTTLAITRIDTANYIINYMFLQKVTKTIAYVRYKMLFCIAMLYMLIGVFVLVKKPCFGYIAKRGINNIFS